MCIRFLVLQYIPHYLHAEAMASFGFQNVLKCYLLSTLISPRHVAFSDPFKAYTSSHLNAKKKL